MIKTRKYLIALFCLLAGGCSLFQDHNPSEATEQWVLKGRLGWKAPADNGQASLYWRQQDNDFTLKLFGPIGQGGGTITGEDGELTITMKGEQPITSSEPERLMMQYFGFFVPIKSLRYWVQGQANPDLPVTSLSYKGEHITAMTQGAWLIDFDRYRTTDARTLPYKVRITHPERSIAVTLIVSRWQWDT